MRRNSKSIWGLQNQMGELIEDEAQLKLLGVSHFFELFSDDGLTNIDDQLKVIRLFPSFVLEDEKESFLPYFSLSKIEVILKGFKNDKIPDPNGWPVEFFLNFFDLLRGDLLKAVECSRISGRITPSLNSTFLVLIPNKNKPVYFADFRPIPL